jgi:hypothetical protein
VLWDDDLVEQNVPSGCAVELVDAVGAEPMFHAALPSFLSPRVSVWHWRVSVCFQLRARPVGLPPVGRDDVSPDRMGS